MSRKYHGGMPDTVIVEKCEICQRKGPVTEEEDAGGRNYDPLDYLPSDSYSYSTRSFDINQAAEGEWFYIPHFTSYINHPISRIAAYCQGRRTREPIWNW